MKKNRDILKAYGWDERDRNGTDMTRGLPQPPTQESFPSGAGLIDLVAPDDLESGSMPILDAIRKRKSRRKFTDEPLSLEELSFLLWSTQGTRDPDKSDDLRWRTVPSGGARHPFETYLVLNRVVGLEAGLYRYLPREHKIYLIRRDPDLPLRVSEGCREQAFVGKAAVVFIWTAVPYRGEWRYSITAHKMIALDAGHVCQNLYLAAEAIDAGTCAIAAYDQDRMDALVGAGGEDEFVIYAAPVGKVNSDQG